MKKTLSTLLLLASTSLFATQMSSTTEITTVEVNHYNLNQANAIFRLGYDLKGSTDDVEGIGASQFGQKLGSAFELSFGSEDKVENFKFGVRRLGNIYYNGRGTFYSTNGYEAEVSNFGVEGSVALFYKATKYFQPYIGVGAGINLGTYDDGGKALTSEKYNPSLHALIGANAQFLGPIGLYAHYKYTISDNSKQNVILRDGSIVPIENRGISGGKWIAGLSLVF